VRNMTFSPQYLVAANLLLLAIVAYSASSIVGTVVAGRLAPDAPVVLEAPPAPLPHQAPKPRSHYQVIVRRDPFNSVKEAPPEPEKAPVGPPPNLALWGVALRAEQADSYCIVEDKKARKQALYRVGDTIDGTSYTVKEIEWEKAVLDSSGSEMVLDLQEPGVGRKSPRGAVRRSTAAAATRVRDDHIREVSTNQYVIDRSEVDHAFENMSQLFTQVRAVPHFEGGKATGFRLFAIRRGSLFDKIGLKNGDILKRINDTEFNDPSRAMAMMQELRDADDLTVQIIRNRRQQTLSYRFQ